MDRNRAAGFSNIDFVFLDRDGVLNRKAAEGSYVTRCEELQLLPGVEEAIALLNRSGRKVIVVTNQRGIARGLYTHQDLARIHEELRQRLSAKGAHLDAIYVCPHDYGQCNCRKPLTGLFEQAFADFPGASADNSVMIGDSLSDIEASNTLGMRSVFVHANVASGSPASKEAASKADLLAVSMPLFVKQYLC